MSSILAADDACTVCTWYLAMCHQQGFISSLFMRMTYICAKDVQW